MADESFGLGSCGLRLLLLCNTHTNKGFGFDIFIDNNATDATNKHLKAAIGLAVHGYYLNQCTNGVDIF